MSKKYTRKLKSKSKLQTDRKWLPNFSELVDRLTIHQLKEVFISEYKEHFRRDMSHIVHDLDLMVQEKNIKLTGELIRVIIVVAQINAHIWYNEAKARQGKSQDLSLLKLTHGLNGIRNSMGNRLLEISNDENCKDHKTDCLAAEHSQWEIKLVLDKNE